jgi:hypothetical protein
VSTDLPTFPLSRVVKFVKSELQDETAVMKCVKSRSDCNVCTNLHRNGHSHDLLKRPMVDFMGISGGTAVRGLERLRLGR